MGQVLHGGARTTAAVRRAIQHSQASRNDLAGRYGINQKTVSKWRKRTSLSSNDCWSMPQNTVSIGSTVGYSAMDCA